MYITTNRDVDEQEMAISMLISNKDNNTVNNILSNSFNEKQFNEMADMIKIEEKDKAKVREFAKEMGNEYVVCMKDLFNQILSSSKHIKEIPESLRFSHQFKQYILAIGLSEKKFYEQSIREIIYYKKSFSFSDFLQCFSKLFQMRQEYTFLKYNFLLHITTRLQEQSFKEEELNKFYSLIHSKRIRDAELENEIKEKLVEKYKQFYPNQNDVFYLKKLSLVLESLFDFK